MLNFSITKKSVSLLVWENAEKGSKGGILKMLSLHLAFRKVNQVYL